MNNNNNTNNNHNTHNNNDIIIIMNNKNNHNNNNNINDKNMFCMHRCVICDVNVRQSISKAHANKNTFKPVLAL